MAHLIQTPNPNTVRISGRVAFDADDDTSVVYGSNYTVSQVGTTSGRFTVTVTDPRPILRVNYAHASLFAAIANDGNFVDCLVDTVSGQTVTFQIRSLAEGTPNTITAAAADAGVNIDVFFCVEYETVI